MGLKIYQNTKLYNGIKLGPTEFIPQYYTLSYTSSIVNGTQACIYSSFNCFVTNYKSTCETFTEGCVLQEDGDGNTPVVSDAFYSDGLYYWDLTNGVASSGTSCPIGQSILLATDGGQNSGVEACHNYYRNNTQFFTSECIGLFSGCTVFIPDCTTISSSNYYSDGTNFGLINSNSIVYNTSSCPSYTSIGLANGASFSGACISYEDIFNRATYYSSCSTLTNNCVVLTENYNNTTTGFYSDGTNAWYITNSTTSAQTSCPVYFTYILATGTTSSNACSNADLFINTATTKSTCSTLSGGCIVYDTNYNRIPNGIYSDGVYSWSATSGVLGSQALCAVISSFTYVASAGTSSQTIVIPSAGQDGDFAVLFDYAHNSTATLPTSVTPSGWSGLTSDTLSAAGNGYRANISSKVLNSSEPNTTITGMTGTANIRKILVVFRPNHTIASYSNPTRNGVITTANPAAQTLILTAETLPQLVFANYVSTGTITTRSATGGLTFVEVRNVATHYVKYAIVNSGTTRNNATVDMDDNGVNTLQSTYFTFT